MDLCCSSYRYRLMPACLLQLCQRACSRQATPSRLPASRLPACVSLLEAACDPARSPMAAAWWLRLAPACGSLLEADRGRRSPRLPLTWSDRSPIGGRQSISPWPERWPWSPFALAARGVDVCCKRQTSGQGSHGSHVGHFSVTGREGRVRTAGGEEKGWNGYTWIVFTRRKLSASS